MTMNICPIRNDWCTSDCEWFNDETTNCCVKDIAIELRKANEKKG